MLNPLITIIVPVYNKEKYVKKCVDSILAQTYTNLEVLLIDDGSTDNSGIICDEYAIADKRVKVVHKTNNGLSSARNAGLDIATGEFVTLVDSDDYIHKLMIEMLYEELAANNADISMCNRSRISIDDAPLQDENNDYKKYLFTGVEATGKIYEDAIFVSACYKLYRIKLFENIRYPLNIIYEDEYLTPRILYNCTRVVFVDKVLYFYVMTQESITRGGFSRKNLDKIFVLKSRMEFFKSKNLERYFTLDQARLFYSYVTLYCQLTENGGESEEKEKIKYELLNNMKLFLNNQEISGGQKVLLKFINVNFIFLDIYYLLYYRRKSIRH